MLNLIKNRNYEYKNNNKNLEDNGNQPLQEQT